MKTKKRVVLTLISTLLLFGLLTGCGLLGAGPRDGNGPRRDGSGGGPCSWFSYDSEKRIELPYLLT